MMKFIAVVLFSLITFTSAQEYVAGKIIKRFSRSGRAATFDPSTECSRTQDVATFCKVQDECETPNELYTCRNGNYYYDPKPCKFCIGVYGSQECSDVAPPLCIISNNLPCDKPGYFPDPLNCYIYHYCYLESGTLKAYTVQCPTGAPFSAGAPQSSKCLVYGPCVKATCTPGLAAEWRPMNYNGFTNNRIAAKCANGKVERVNVCPGGQSHDLTYTLAPKCAIKCVTNYQKAVYVPDKSMYYQCILGTVSLDRCQPPQIFDPEKLVCA